MKTPREVRTVLAYLLLNFCKHLDAAPGIDPRSSGRWFDGWAGFAHPPPQTPLASPRTWLLTIGWRRGGGPIHFSEAPSPTPRPIAA